VGLPLLLTAALLHAAPKCLPGEAVPRKLPANFVPAALAVVRVLNNFARWGRRRFGGAGVGLRAQQLCQVGEEEGQ